jgi:hypothetical protein
LSGRGLCDELITRPEESYRLCCVVVCDLETSRICTPYIYVYDISTLRFNGRHTWFLFAQTPSSSKLFVPCTHGLVCRRVLCVLSKKCTLHSNHRLTRVIFQKKTFSSERPFSHYIHSHRLAAEMWTTIKKTYWGNIFWVVASICTCFVNTCPTVFL